MIQIQAMAKLVRNERNMIYSFRPQFDLTITVLKYRCISHVSPWQIFNDPYGNIRNLTFCS